MVAVACSVRFRLSPLRRFIVPIYRKVYGLLYNGRLINFATETLTPTEAVFVSGVSVRDVHRVIDEHILPENFYDTQDARSFKSHACVFIAFYFGAVNRLTSEERQRAISLASRSSSDVKSRTRTIQDEFLTIDLAPFWKSVDERLAHGHFIARVILEQAPNALKSQADRLRTSGSVRTALISHLVKDDMRRLNVEVSRQPFDRRQNP